MIADVAGYIATAVVIGAYYAARRFDRPVAFDVANAVGWPFVAWSAITHRAFPSLLITVSFGTIGIFGLVKAYRDR